MATISDVKEAIQRLVNAEALEIPGLDLESVVEGFVETTYGADLAKIQDSQMRQEEKDKLVNYYMTGNAKELMQAKINSMKKAFKEVTDTLTAIPESVTSTIAMFALPPAIAVPPAAPNPAYTIIDGKIKVAGFEEQLNSASTALLNICQAAVEICFPLPDAIVVLIDTIATVKSVIKTIPV